MSKKVSLKDWKWLRKISGNDVKAVRHYTEIARINEALMVEIPNVYAYNIYLPTKADKASRNG